MSPTEDGKSLLVYADQLLKFEFSHVKSTKKCVISRLGISLLPKIALQQENETGQLKDLHWTSPDFNIITQMIYHKDKWLSPALTSFIQLTKKILKSASS